MRILQINSSITGEASVSRHLTDHIVDTIGRAIPGAQLVTRDLDREPLPHLNSRHISAMEPQARVSELTKMELEIGAATLEEFLTADVVVIGAPMYNFSIASQLKAWIDRIVVAGQTFSYSADGAKGLAGGKRVIIASSRGGIYTGDSPVAALDFQETYLRAIFGFIGINDVEFVRAEGVSLGPDQREVAFENAVASFQLNVVGAGSARVL